MNVNPLGLDFVISLEYKPNNRPTSNQPRIKAEVNNPVASGPPTEGNPELRVETFDSKSQKPENCLERALNSSARPQGPSEPQNGTAIALHRKCVH